MSALLVFEGMNKVKRVDIFAGTVRFMPLRLAVIVCCHVCGAARIVAEHGAADRLERMVKPILIFLLLPAMHCMLHKV